MVGSIDYMLFGVCVYSVFVSALYLRTVRKGPRTNKSNDSTSQDS